MDNPNEFPERLRFQNWLPVFWLLALAFFVALLIRNAWICDDALITMRSIDNLTHGFGFGYNLSERVQSFTHPLWALLITPIYSLTEEAYFTLLVPAIVFTLASVILLSLTARSLHMGIIALVMLAFSKAFMDYSTSGLENPLTHFFLVLFFILSQKDFKPPLIVFALIAGLATLNRMDTLLFYLPYLAFEFWEKPKMKTLLIIGAGFLPFIAWEIYSLIYFGFPFPNTAYSKLKIGVPKMDLIRQGLTYMEVSFKMDPITPIMILLSLVSIVFKKRRHFLTLAIGMVLYLAYTVWVGGDFMAGRWLTGPLMMAVLILSRWELKMRWALPAFVVLIIFGWIQPLSPIKCDGEYFMDKKKKERKEMKLPVHGIVDEKQFYFENLGLLSKKRVKGIVSPWKGKEVSKNLEVTEYRASFGIGYWGFRSGPGTHYVDYYALVDPLLSRLPSRISKGWRPGHWERMIPEGYFQSLRSGANLIKDKELAEFYEKVKIIASGPIWTWKRFETIAKMNFGHYDELIVKDRWQDAKELRRTAASPEIHMKKSEKYPSKGFNTMQIDPEAGLFVDLMKEYHDSLVNISLNHNSAFEISVLKGSEVLKRLELGPADSVGEGLAVYQFILSDSVARAGYDFVRIVPLTEGQESSIGHLRFGKN